MLKTCSNTINDSAQTPNTVQTVHLTKKLNIQFFKTYKPPYICNCTSVNMLIVTVCTLFSVFCTTA